MHDRPTINPKRSASRFVPRNQHHHAPTTVNKQHLPHTHISCIIVAAEYLAPNRVTSLLVPHSFSCVELALYRQLVGDVTRLIIQ